MTTAFVLGGGGHLGAHQVGMLQAVIERGIRPDFIVGTSIGALNGAVLAGSSDVGAVDQLANIWTGIDRSGVLNNSIFSQIKTFVSSKTHLHDNSTFRKLVAESVGTDRFEDLATPFECVAACIERATATYFSDGSLIDSIIASAAVPGLFPPVEIGGEHFLDGGLVASIPLDRAVTRGATTVYVFQVGRIEDDLVAPSKPWEVAMIAFEISRRHRFTETMANLPDDVAVHVLPTGDSKAFNDLSQYRGTNRDGAARRIEVSYDATAQYLDRLGAQPEEPRS